MKVFFSTHSWLPVRYEGANVYHHELAKIMLSWGWEINVCSDVCKEAYELEGVKVNPFSCHVSLSEWCDIVVTIPMQMKRTKGKPVFVVKHNMNNESQECFKGKGILFCADHVKKLGEYGAARSFVWHPMNRYERTELKGDPDGYATLVNCNNNKGGEKLILLAKRMPDVLFLGVMGAYDSQKKEETLPNLNYAPSTNDMSHIYNMTSVLLILSHREGCPTVAQEAMSFGIPVISFHLDGVKEVCGDKAIYCNSLSEVAAAIESRPGFITPPIIERDYEGLKSFFTIK